MRRRKKIIPFSKMSLPELNSCLLNTEKRLKEASETHQRRKIEYESKLSKKAVFDRLTGERTRLRETAYNRLGAIKKLITKIDNQPLNKDETVRINQIKKEIELLNYTQSYLGYSPTPPIDSHIVQMRNTIDKIKFMIESKEESEAKRVDAEKKRQAKRSKERAIIASAQGKTRALANSIKRALKKEIEEFPNCPYCGEPLGNNPHCDHIYPVSHGGHSDLANMVYICSSCNFQKRDLTLREFLQLSDLSRDKVEKNLEKMRKRF